MDNYAFAEHLRKNYITIDSLELGGFKIGGLDFKSNTSLVSGFHEACTYLIKRNMLLASTEYISYPPSIENIRLIFWVGLLHHRILNKLAEELKSYSRSNFWCRYRCMVWDKKPFGSYDYVRDTIVVRIQEQVDRFSEISKKAEYILTLLGNEEIGNL